MGRVLRIGKDNMDYASKMKADDKFFHKVKGDLNDFKYQIKVENYIRQVAELRKKYPGDNTIEEEYNAHLKQDEGKSIASQEGATLRDYVDREASEAMGRIKQRVAELEKSKQPQPSPADEPAPAPKEEETPAPKEEDTPAPDAAPAPAPTPEVDPAPTPIPDTPKAEEEAPTPVPDTGTERGRSSGTNSRRSNTESRRGNTGAENRREGTRDERRNSNSSTGHSGTERGRSSGTNARCSSAESRGRSSSPNSNARNSNGQTEN